MNCKARTLSLATLLATLIPGAAHAAESCIAWEAADYEGAPLLLAAGTEYKTLVPQTALSFPFPGGPIFPGPIVSFGAFEGGIFGDLFGGPTAPPAGSPNLDDKISSVWVATGCSLSLHENNAFEGQALWFLGGGAPGGLKYRFVGPEFNDIASSLQCSCPAKGPSGVATPGIVFPLVTPVSQ